MALTAERLRQSLHFDATTGIFTWIDPGRRTERIGLRAGSVKVHGYRHIQIDGVAHAEHRLAWLYVHGCWPTKHIDHVNGDRADNRTANLREANASQNHGNSKRSARNTSGFKGVYFEKGVWVATIRIAGRKTRLGRFASPEAAHEAYVAAASQEFGEFARAG